MAQYRYLTQAVTLPVILLAIAGSVQSSLDYPGRAAFKQLNEYLQKGGVVVKPLEENLQAIGDLLESLENDTKLVAPRHLMQAAQLVLEMQKAAEFGHCNATTVQLIAHTTMGAYPDDSSVRFDHPKHLAASSLANTITRLVHQILLKCELTAEPRLTRAIEPIAAEMTSKLESYLSEEFLARYVEAPQADIQLGKLCQDLLSARRNFKSLPYPLVLSQLFNVSRSDTKLKDTGTFQVDYQNRTYNWCKVRKNLLQELVGTYIIDPCRTYVDQTRSVFGLYYFAKTYYVNPSPETSYPTFDFNFFLSKVSNDFKYRMFRYEFCYKYALEAPFWTQVWRHYVEITHEATLRGADSAQSGGP